MANNNNNNKSKTGGFSPIKNKIDDENNKKYEGNMATCNSIIKKTEYWLPDELWGQVKDFMGLCKKEHEVNWELIKKAKKKDLFLIGLPQYNITFNKKSRPLIEIGPSGVPFLVDKKGNKIKPAELYFKTLKRLYMKNRLMTPAKWIRLSNNMTNKFITGFDRAMEGDKFTYTKFRTFNYLRVIKDAECEIIKKNKTRATIKFRAVKILDPDAGQQNILISYSRGEFNNLGIYKDVKML